MSGLRYGKFPAVITSYDPSTRECEVAIDGQTNGGEDSLRAEIEYPIGDKSRHGTQTEIEILVGDLVWIEFIQGDPRAPLITGWRNPTKGNSEGWRRWHHANIQLKADDDLRLDSGKTIHIEAGSNIQLKVGGSVINISAAQIEQLASMILLN